MNYTMSEHAPSINQSEGKNTLLGNYTENVVKPPEKTDYILRYKLQKEAQRLLPEERVSWCSKRTLPYVSTIPLSKHKTSPRARFSNLARCESPWSCPVCSGAITYYRALELEAAVSQTEYSRVMLTLTLSHLKRWKLAKTIERLSKSWRSMVQNKAWRVIREEFAIVGYVRAVEVTYTRNGWHPHFHILIFSTIDLQPFTSALEQHIWYVWKHALSVNNSHASRKHGIDVVAADERIKDYVAKFGRLPAHMWTEARELVSGASKRSSPSSSSRTPFELLHDSMSGDQNAGALFIEYALTMRRKHQIEWSAGLQAILGIQAIRTDREAAYEAEIESWRVLGLFSIGTWLSIYYRGMRGDILNAVALLDPEQFLRWLALTGIEIERLQESHK